MKFSLDERSQRSQLRTVKLTYTAKGSLATLNLAGVGLFPSIDSLVDLQQRSLVELFHTSFFSTDKWPVI